MLDVDVDEAEVIVLERAAADQVIGPSITQGALSSWQRSPAVKVFS
ncbi:hypothetical protein [Microvirga aerophila]|nr:hypothetical protein [Microvirga aerophila]